MHFKKEYERLFAPAGNRISRINFYRSLGRMIMFPGFSGPWRRTGLHLAFWLAYWFIYAYTYSRYDGNLFKYMLTEGFQMPARILGTYVAFGLLDRFRHHSWWAFLGVALATLAGGMLNRLLKLEYLVPVYFPDSTIVFWDLNRLMVDVFDCALATGTALSARLFFRQQESLRREEQLKREKSDAELLAIKSQIQPHFLFNTINNLYALARIKSDKAAPVALQLANLLRFVLYETRKPSIPIEQEIRILTDYIALEQLRFDEDRLKLDLIIELDDPQQPVTPLLLLPLVENAFKHGVGELPDDAWVHISVRLNAKKLSVAVDNSIRTDQRTESNGIGLRNLRRQLELIYPDCSELTIRSEANGKSGPGKFTAQLEIRFPES